MNKNTTVIVHFISKGYKKDKHEIRTYKTCDGQKIPESPEPDLGSLKMLAQNRALYKTSHRSSYEPTFLGRLLSSFLLSFDVALMIVKLGEMGMLREVILLGILVETQSLPIIRLLGQEILNVQYTDSYFFGQSSDTGLTGKEEQVLIANLCAFQFWQRVYKENAMSGMASCVAYGLTFRLLLNIYLRTGDDVGTTYEGVDPSLSQIPALNSSCMDTIQSRTRRERKNQDGAL